jgi:hypothetical protein
MGSEGLTAEGDMRDISTCWQYAPHGWHAHAAGPCFERYEQAVAYRDWLEGQGLTWASDSDRALLGWYRNGGQKLHVQSARSWASKFRRGSEE